MDWALVVFRSALLSCAILALVAATQFDIAASAEAVWNHNLTTDEIVGAREVAAMHQADCLAVKAKTTEYPASCYRDPPTQRGLPSEKAIENIRWFVTTITVLLIVLFSVVVLGVRMGREN